MSLLRKLMGNNKELKIDMNIYSPIKGVVTSLSNVNDPVFSEELMGKGIAIIPESDRVVAPCNGEIISVFKTLHALTIRGENGAEVIIHVGLETVALNGQYFEAHVHDGQQIKKGDLLLTFDLDAIKTDYDIVTPVIITNSSGYQTIEQTKNQKVKEGDLLIKLIK